MRRAGMARWAQSVGGRHVWLGVLGGVWREHGDVGRSARAFESDLDGGCGRSSSGDEGARMTRGRGLTEAGERARVRRGWGGGMWGGEDRLERKGRMGWTG